MFTGSGESDDQWSVASPQEYQGEPSSSSNSSLQQVPQSACRLTKLLHSVGIDSHEIFATVTPFLKIVEQPQSHYKFRYRSEMENSHGCLYGKTYENDKTLSKTYPEAELCNYNGKAKIKCELVQVNNTYEHPHRLCVNDKEEIAVDVPVIDNYTVRFRGLCIVHKAQKEIKNWLFRGHNPDNLSPEEIRTLYQKCESMTKLIDLNRLRLKFSAVDLDSNREICDPVYSEPIHNLKNPKTNILKICRMSRSNSRVTGGDDVIMLVEKVVKKNITIRFFEKPENGEELWSAKANFMENDVHHQYAIVFRTPPYKDVNISTRVKVWVQLERPSDGQRSDPREFFYTPRAIVHASKKRKLHQDSSKTYNSGPAQWNPTLSHPRSCMSTPNNEVNVPGNSNPSETTTLQSNNGGFRRNPVLLNMAPESGNAAVFCENLNPVLDNALQGNVEVSPADTSTSHSLPLSNDATSYDDIGQFESVFNACIDSPTSLFADLLDFMESENVHSDSGRGEATNKETTEKTTNKTENNVDDKVIIQQMVKRLQSMLKLIRILEATRKDTLRKSLEALFELRLTNGDTFLHLILSSKQPLLDYVINQVHDSKMVHLLNLGNAKMQTILHLAVVNYLPDLIPMLLSKGCDPMLEDIDGNNAVHYAVVHQCGLEPLLKAIKELNIPHNLDAHNNEMQTALHCAAIYKSESSSGSLIASGARCTARDGRGRTPLHLAAYDGCLPVLSTLLNHVLPKDVDAMDESGYTVLQIICDQDVKEGSLEIVKTLLEKNADPTLKRGRYKTSAWSLAKYKPEIRDVMREYLDQEPTTDDDDDDDDDSEDEFESADEGEYSDQDNELSDIIEPLGRMTTESTEEQS